MRKQLVVLLVLWVSACATPPSPTPLPTPQLVRVAYPPSLSPLSDSLSRCARQIPGMVLGVFETPVSALDVQRADVTIWLGEPPGEVYAALLGREEIQVIVHPDNPVDEISIAELRGLFKGTINNWEDVGGDESEVAVWVYPPGNELQRILESVILQGQPFTSQAWQAPDAAAMREAVAQDPAAIGILPHSWLSGAGKTIEIDPDLEELLLQPVLALTEEEPEGILREFVACLQG